MDNFFVEIANVTQNSEALMGVEILTKMIRDIGRLRLFATHFFIDNLLKFMSLRIVEAFQF